MPWDGHSEMQVHDKYLHECLADLLSAHNYHPGTTLTIGYHKPNDHENCFGEGRWCFWSSILKDGQHIYRIGNYHQDTDTWHARWPD